MGSSQISERLSCDESACIFKLLLDEMLMHVIQETEQRCAKQAFSLGTVYGQASITVYNNTISATDKCYSTILVLVVRM